MPFVGPVDAFPGPSYDAVWTTVQAGCSIVSGRSRQEMTTAYNEISTAFSYTLDEGETLVEVEMDVTGDNQDAYLYVGKAPGNRAVIERIGTLLYFVSGGTDTSITYDPVAHRWWRVVESGADLLFYTAPDGATWTLRRTVTGHAMDLTAVRVLLGAGRNTTTGGPFYCYFDNLNTPGTAPPAVPAISFVSVSALDVATTATNLGTLPAGIQQGDLLLAWVVGRPAGAAGTNDSISLDQGYTLHGSRVRVEVGTNDLVGELWWKIAGASETTAPTVTVGSNLQGTAAGHSITILALRAIDGGTFNSADPFDATAVGSTSAAAATWAPTGITTATANAWAVSLVATADNNTLGYSVTQSFADRASGASYETTTGGDHAVGVATKAVAAPAAVTMPTWEQLTLGNDAWVGLSAAVRLVVPRRRDRVVRPRGGLANSNFY